MEITVSTRIEDIINQVPAPSTEEQRRNRIDAIFYHNMLIAKQKFLRRLMIKQKLIGIGILLMSILVVIIASQGNPMNPNDTDVTVILLTIPMGLSMLFSRKICIMPNNRDYREIDTLKERYKNALK